MAPLEHQEKTVQLVRMAKWVNVVQLVLRGFRAMKVQLDKGVMMVFRVKLVREALMVDRE